MDQAPPDQPSDAAAGGAPAKDAKGSETQAASRLAFLKDNLLVFATLVLTKMKGIIVLPILVKGMGVDQYGVWVQILAFTSLAMGLVGLNLHLPLLRFYKKDRVYNGRVYTTLLLSTIAQTSVSCLAIYLLAPSSAADVFIGTRDRDCLFYGLVLVVLNAIRNLNVNHYRAERRFVARSIVDVGATLVEIVAVVLAMRGGTSLVPALRVMAIIGVGMAAVTTLHVLWTLGPRRPNREILMNAFRYTLPLLPGSVCIWILDRSDRFIIAHFLGDAAVGRYSTHYALGSLLTFLFGPLQTTLIPRVNQMWDEDAKGAVRTLETSMRVYVLVALPGIAGIGALAEPVLAVMTSKEVAEGSRLSTLLIAAGVATWGFSILVSSVFYANKETKIVSLYTMLTAALNLGLNVLLVPRIGVLASGLVTFVSYAATCVAFGLRARRVAVIKYPVREAGFGIVASAAMYALLHLWAPSHLVTIALAGAAGLALYVALAAATNMLPFGMLRARLRRARP